MNTTLVIYASLRTMCWLAGFAFCFRERNVLGVIGFGLAALAVPVNAISHATRVSDQWSDAATILSTPAAAFIAAALIHRQKRDGVWTGPWRT